jgi:hypothetical protein
MTAAGPEAHLEPQLVGGHLIQPQHVPCPPEALKLVKDLRYAAAINHPILRADRAGWVWDTTAYCGNALHMATGGDLLSEREALKAVWAPVNGQKNKEVMEEANQLLAWARVNKCPWNHGTAHSVKEVIIPHGVESIDGGFEGCEVLSEVDIPKTVKVIDNRSFASCLALTKVHIPGSVEHIGPSAFSGCGLCEMSFRNSQFEGTVMDNSAN